MCISKCVNFYDCMLKLFEIKYQIVHNHSNNYLCVVNHNFNKYIQIHIIFHCTCCVLVFLIILITFRRVL